MVDPPGAISPSPLSTNGPPGDDIVLIGYALPTIAAGSSITSAAPSPLQ